MKRNVLNLLGQHFWMVSSLFVALLVVSLAGRFALDYWVHGRVQDSRAQLATGALSLQDNQDLLLKVKNGELVFQKYLASRDPAHRNSFRLTHLQVQRIIEQLRSSAEDPAVASLYARVDVLLTGLFDAMSELVHGQLPSAEFLAKKLAVADQLDVYEAELEQLIRFIQVLKVERAEVVSGNLDEMILWSHALNVFTAILALFLLAFLAFSVRSMLSRPLRSLSEQLRVMDAAAPVTLKSETAQSELQILLCRFNQLILRLRERDQALKQARDVEVQVLEKALTERVEYSSVLAHEIRTPLTTLIGQIHLLSEKAVGASEQREFWLIQQVADDLLQLVNSTLEYSRISAGQETSVAQDEVSIPSILHTLDTRFAARAADKGVQWRLESDLVAGESVVMDYTKMLQISSNLIDNALKFTHAGGAVQVKLAVLPKTDQAPEFVLEVIDSGIGMSESGQARIFEPFKQADTGIKRRFGGTGLGLALSKRLAEVMGGRIEVRSQLGVGSTFRVVLPVQLAKRELVANSPKKSTNSTLTNLNGKRVLMVEDHRINARINMKVLGKHGLVFEWAETGEQALERFTQAGQFDLVLMDINLGEGMSGVEAAAALQLRFGPQCPPVVALTAGVVGGQAQSLRDAGLYDVIEKPFNLEAALSLLSRALGGQAISHSANSGGVQTVEQS